MNSFEKRSSVKKDYDIIANQYCKEFGIEIYDMELVKVFCDNLKPAAKVVDLGGGSGKVTNYLIKHGYDAVCYDFSEQMKNNAKKLFPNISYILDDMLDIKKHFNDKSLDGIIALYSLFHIPKENINKLFYDIYDVLKFNGVFCFSLQLGNGERFVDEPYLREDGKNVLYMNYSNKNHIYDLLGKIGFEIVYEIEKQETGENVIGEDGNEALYILAVKRS